MEAISVVQAARQSLGPVGVYLPVPFSSTPPVSVQCTAAARLEAAGYRAAWVNETSGGPGAGQERGRGLAQPGVVRRDDRPARLRA